MSNILIFNSDDRPFEVAAIEHLFRSEPSFRNICFHEPGGAVLQADYVEPEYHTIVRLNENQCTISLSGTSDTALRAALFLQRNIITPLRMVDTDYSFDLILSSFTNIEELQAAIDEAQAD